MTHLDLVGFGWDDPILLAGCVAVGVVVKRPWMVMPLAVVWSLILTALPHPFLIALTAGIEWILLRAIGAAIAASLVFLVAESARRFLGKRRSKRGPGA